MADDSDNVPRAPFGRLALEDLEALSGKAQSLIEAVVLSMPFRYQAAGVPSQKETRKP